MPKPKPENDTVKKELMEVHPTWVRFIRYCAAIRFGELQNVKIQNGVPVSAEKATEKIRFEK